MKVLEDTTKWLDQEEEWKHEIEVVSPGGGVEVQELCARIKRVSSILSQYDSSN